MMNADVMAEMAAYGPRRFALQPKAVRRRGRKGLALLDRSKRRRTKARRRAHMESASSGRDYRELMREYGAYGSSRRKKSKRRRKSSRSSSSRAMTRRQRRKLNRQLARTRSSKRSRRGASTRSRRGSSKRSRRGTSRRARSSKRSRRGSSRRALTRQARKSTRLIRRRASRVLSYSTLMSTLRRKPKLKAWVCVGRKRTGCGGGRKGRRGSRQFGVLRP